MSKTKSKNNTAKWVLLIIVFAVVAFAASIGIQLWMSPDFNGFGRDTLPEPVVTFLPGGGIGDSGTDVTGENVYNWRDHPVLIVGDSLTEGARKEISKVVPDATIDAKVSRNMATGVQILKEWDGVGLVPDDAIIVVCLANNITDSTLKNAQEVVDMIRPGQCLIMMTGHGRSNMEPVNALIRDMPLKTSFVVLADWDRTIAQSLGLLGDDGIHINGSKGNAVYADLIVTALEAARPKP